MISLNPALTSKVRMPRINKHSDYYLRKQVTVVITLSPLCRSCHSPTILTKKTTMPKGEVQYIFHCYFSFAFFLQLVAFRCRNALITASDWLVLPILDAVFSLFSLSLACDLSTLFCFCFGGFSFGPTHPPHFFSPFLRVFFFFMSSTWRELAAIVSALESFGPILEGSLVKWFTVSQTAARIIEVGSMKLDLHRLAIKIFSVLRGAQYSFGGVVDPTY